MQIYLHQTHHTIGDFDGIFTYLKKTFTHPETKGLHLFPELFLTGYPLQDLCLQRPFIEQYEAFLQTLDSWSQKTLKSNHPMALLLGGLAYEYDEQGIPLTIKNVIYLLAPGKKREILYTKQLLPNYDIFDEKKYFTSGNENKIWEFDNKKIALMICEDMWPSSQHPNDPVTELEKIKDKVDLVVNLSASPFHLGKFEKRVIRGQEISSALAAPFIYVNRVGGEDEILFDGRSFVVIGEEKILEGKRFKSDILQFTLDELKLQKNLKQKKIHNTWESLFNAKFDQSTPPKVQYLSDDDCELIIQSLTFGLQEYARKCGFSKFSVALSGGIDSSLVLALVKLALLEDQELEAIFMPGLYTSSLSYDMSTELCKRLQVKLWTMPIKFFHSAIKNAHMDNFKKPLEGIADENIQSRLRGTLIYTRSNEWNSMVLNTSNKSELAVGYSTQYGDSVGALSLLGDLYKSEVFRLSQYINKKYGDIIPSEIISRPPSAELRENQEDIQSLPPYDRLDAILEGFLSYRYTLEDLTQLGFSQEEVQKVYRLYLRSEYKRKQFCPIIKIRAKSFGFGYRIPICKKLIE